MPIFSTVMNLWLCSKKRDYNNLWLKFKLPGCVYQMAVHQEEEADKINIRKLPLIALGKSWYFKGRGWILVLLQIIRKKCIHNSVYKEKK